VGNRYSTSEQIGGDASSVSSRLITQGVNRAKRLRDHEVRMKNKSINERKVIKTFAEHSATQESSRQVAPSLLDLSPFARARECVQ